MQPPNTLRQGESPEFPMVGPFAGIQSEIPQYLIERIAGFFDVNNIMFWKSQACTRPGYTALTALPAPANEAIVGIANFFTIAGVRIQVVITPTRLLQWNGGGAGSWTAITGVLSGGANDLFTWDVVGDKLLFCQGIDKVKLWDGIGANFSDSSASAVPAKYLAEIDNRLVVGNTTEAGVIAPQRVRWTGPGDATDWTSLSSGQTDLFNDLGPITGILKLGQQGGFIWQNFGIVQVQLTGFGLAPFRFSLLGGKDYKGCPYPATLKVHDSASAIYLGSDNVYMFNSGGVSEPIGDFPLEGRMRQGALSRILNDVRSAALPTVISAAVSNSINSQSLDAYWLNIPGVAVWVFNFKEFNWTRWTYDRAPKVMDRFSKQGVIRIMDLTGPILSQNWTPATIGINTQSDVFLIGFGDGTPGLVDLNSFSELPWSLLTAGMIFGDTRHEKTVIGVRIVLTDLGSVTFNVTVSNEKGDTQTKTVTTGSASGVQQTLIATVKITGMFITIKLSGAAGQGIFVNEISPIYQVANEYKTNTF